MVSGVRSQNVCLLRLVLRTHIAIYIRLLDNLFGSIHDTSARDDIHAYFMNMFYYTQVNTTSVTSVGHYKWIITVSWTTFRTNCKRRYNLGPVLNIDSVTNVFSRKLFRLSTSLGEVVSYYCSCTEENLRD